MSGKIVDSNAYVHTQSSASSTWTVPHGLVKMAIVVDVWVDIEGVQTKVSPLNIDITSPYTCDILFSEPLTGKAIIV